MNVDTLFPSRFVKGEDIAAKGTVTVTIRSVTIEKMGKDQEENPVVWFEKTDKGMVLKKTNAMTIKALYGADTDGWTGKRITLTTETMRAFGDMQTVIKVVNQVPAAPQRTQQVVQPASRPEPWEATEYRRKIVQLSDHHDALFLETSDVSELRSLMRENDNTEDDLSVMSREAYRSLCTGIDQAVGSEGCAEPILTYLLGRVIGRDTMPDIEAGGILLDDLADEQDFVDALMAVWSIIKQEVKAT